MKVNRWLTIASLALASSVAFAQNMPPEYDGVLKTLGKQGDFKANVLKLNIPETT